MRAALLVVFVVASLSAPAIADTPPTKQQALDTVTAWRTAIQAVPCDRKSPKDPFVCSGAGVKATMPAPVSFGMLGESNVVCEDSDGYQKWDGAKKGMQVVEVAADYDQLAGCLEGMLEYNGSAPLTVISASAANKFLSKPARKQLKPLAKTHKLVRMKLAPGDGDDYNHYDVILAVTLADDGTPKVTAVFAQLKRGDPGGE